MLAASGRLEHSSISHLHCWSQDTRLYAPRPPSPLEPFDDLADIIGVELQDSRLTYRH